VEREGCDSDRGSLSRVHLGDLVREKVISTGKKIKECLSGGVRILLLGNGRSPIANGDPNEKLRRDLLC